MSIDDPILTAGEARAAAALRVALHEIAAAEPFRIDPEALTAPVARNRVVRGHLPIGLAAALAVVLIAGLAVLAAPRLGIVGSPTSAPTLPGTPGDFDNGSFSFDYPTSWRVLAGDYLEGMAVQVYAVLGTGDWKSGCTFTDNGGSCTGDTADVSGGRVVVRIWSLVSGPMQGCTGDNQATATFGSNAVVSSTYGSAADWQIRYPGAEFFKEGNVDVAVWSDGPAGIAQAEALIASFRWDAGAGNASGNCATIYTPAPPTVLPGPS